MNYHLEMMSIALNEANYEFVTKMANTVINKTDMKGEGYHFLGVAAARQSRHEEAIELYNKALEFGVLQPATTHWHKGKALHCIGRYKEGWTEYEWRALESGHSPFTRFEQHKLWRNQPPPASIHIHLEAGAGDNINFVRYLKLLVDKGYDVRYETYYDMVDLMTRSFPDVKVTGRALDYPGAEGLEPFDYHHPICGLPHVLGTEIDTIPWFGPYIKPDPELVKKYAEKLPKDKKKIGICWFSGIRKGGWIEKYGNYKSIHFDKLKPLFEIDNNLHFVSLQVGKRRKQNMGIISDILPEDDNITWDDTAALVENLDLVISVDTAVMHLAGAMNKPVWIMAQRDCTSWHLLCWRPGAFWNELCPWYSTMRVFRQHRFNEPNYWDEVIGDIYKEIEKWKIQSVQ